MTIIRTFYKFSYVYGREPREMDMPTFKVLIRKLSTSVSDVMLKHALANKA
jgi:hypothetical protein